jgi:hypothetical protein
MGVPGKTVDSQEDGIAHLKGFELGKMKYKQGECSTSFTIHQPGLSKFSKVNVMLVWCSIVPL